MSLKRTNAGIKVSIHASPQQRGELIERHTPIPALACFNPRLTSAARRTRGSRTDVLSAYEFQSTPHLSSEANASVSLAPIDLESFNPRLTSAARRTSKLSVRFLAVSRFNPRLTSAARRTKRLLSLAESCSVSIHASPQQRAEMHEENIKVERIDVSIHPPPHQRGELGIIRNRDDVQAGFNPRLTSSARRT